MLEVEHDTEVHAIYILCVEVQASFSQLLQLVPMMMMMLLFGDRSGGLSCPVKCQLRE